MTRKKGEGERRGSRRGFHLKKRPKEEEERED
jgi:hypothetical protein